MVNINQFLKQAQSMQKKMQEVQEQLENTEFTGQSGGGQVSLTINGKHKMSKIVIDPTLCVPEEKEILEDLIIAAYNQAKQKCDEANEQSMSSSLGSSLPPGFKLPF